MNKVVLGLARDVIIQLGLLKNSLVRILLCLLFWRDQRGLNHLSRLSLSVNARVILFLGDVLCIDTCNSQRAG